MRGAKRRKGGAGAGRPSCGWRDPAAAARLLLCLLLLRWAPLFSVTILCPGQRERKVRPFSLDMQRHRWRCLCLCPPGGRAPAWGRQLSLLGTLDFGGTLWCPQELGLENIDSRATRGKFAWLSCLQPCLAYLTSCGTRNGVSITPGSECNRRHTSVCNRRANCRARLYPWLP